ncbi:nudix hydrolase 2-like [Prosopis cineraria]|uniref:nudix hydrolase 2-like n=1 Tax=Prosopis cineraria TaxID=364024 RepID=UPI0024103C13|nr:nudix hydrolase 2-like [Prosopis cineraria]
MTNSTSSAATAPQVVHENGVGEIKLLSSTDDDYGGVIVEMDGPMDSTTFLSILRASISHWRQLGKKTIWIKLPIHLVSVVEPLVKEGFGYHHAEPEYLMLVYSILESANTIPANATHRVGVGAFVMNEKREILAVKEKSGPFIGVWKFPTGTVDQGEDLCAAAIREVKEETGVDTEFVEVLAFRQMLETYFTKSELFVLCILRPLSFDIQVQEQEIEAAQWMPWEDYAAQPFMEKQEIKKMNEAFWAKIDGHYSGFTPHLTSSSFSDKKCLLFLNSEGA